MGESAVYPNIIIHIYIIKISDINLLKTIWISINFKLMLPFVLNTNNKKWKNNARFRNRTQVFIIGLKLELKKVVTHQISRAGLAGFRVSYANGPS